MPGPSASSAALFPRPGACYSVNIYEAQFPGSQDNLCLIYSPDFPLEEPSYLFSLHIYRLSPSLPRWQGCGKRPRRLTLRHQLAARTTSVPGTDTASCLLHPVSAWSGGVQDRGTAPGAPLSTDRCCRTHASAVAEAGAASPSLRKPAERALEPSRASPAQPSARGWLGKQRLTGISPGRFSHRPPHLAFLRGAAAEPQHPPPLTWAALLKTLKHTGCSLGTACLS